MSISFADEFQEDLGELLNEISCAFDAVLTKILEIVIEVAIALDDCEAPGPVPNPHYCLETLPNQTEHDETERLLNQPVAAPQVINMTRSSPETDPEACLREHEEWVHMPSEILIEE